MEILNLVKKTKYYSQEEISNLEEILKHLKIDTIGLSICKNLLEIKVDFITLVCGLVLKEYRENKEILNILPSGTEKILEALVKIDNVNIVDNEITTENIKNLLISIANDIRVIIIKLSEILSMAQNLLLFSESEQKYLHTLIKELYAPISARLGLSVIKSKLQDLNVEYFHPREYDKIKRELSALKVERERELNKNITYLKEMLKKLNINGDVYGRIKHISSIYNKLKDKNLTLSTIYDLLAVRVIVEDVNECYVVLSEINSVFKPIDGRFKDYIIRPKQNGYKSIHTTVISSNSDPLEIQIRTKEMHEFAEYGVAAHFLYKEKKSKTSQFDEKITWVRRMLENSDLSSSSDYLDELKNDLYANEIFVQTPLGKVISLKENATPIDFAYAIHSEVGNKCVGAKINGKIVPLTSHLKNGDVVEIITNPNSKGPSRDWLKIVNSTLAKNRMRAFFKREMKEENIKKGKSMLEATAKIKKVDLKNLLVEDWLKELYDKWTLKSLDDLYSAVGYGGLTSTQVINKLYNKYRSTLKTERVFSQKQNPNKKQENAVEFEGIDNLMVRYAKCCSPVPGDEIFGFISQGRGIAIHTKSCPNIAGLDKNRIIKAKWLENLDKKFTCSFNIQMLKNGTSVLELTKKLTELKVELMGLKVSNLDSFTNLIQIEVNVKDTEELTSLINKLSQDKNIIKIERAKGF